MSRKAKPAADAADQDKGGRPRKYATPEQFEARFAEAHRLELERDAAAARWEAEQTVAAKAALCAIEQRLASAWSAALRADGKLGPALKYSDAAVKWAAAHKAAVEQLSADRVAELHARVARRARAAEMLAADLEQKP